jgi:hypothetical protein
MSKFRTGVAIAALLVGVTAAVVWLDRLGKAADEDGPWKEYQHTVSAADPYAGIASPAPMPEWMKAEITDPSRAIYEITTGWSLPANYSACAYIR